MGRNGRNSGRCRVLYAGAHGIRNAGDELPLLLMREQLEALHPARAFTHRALSRHPDPWAEEQLKVRHVPNPEHPSSAEARGRWFRGLNPGDDTAPLRRLTAEIRAADLLVIGAGNALTDLTIDVLRGPIPLLALYGFLAQVHGTPVALYGMSVGPLRTRHGRDLAGWLARSAAVVTVRDRESAELLRQLTDERVPIHLLPDATLAAEPASAHQARRALADEGIDPAPGPWLAVGMRDPARVLGREAGAAADAALVATLDAFADTHRVLFVPQSTYVEDDDRAHAARIAGRTRAQCHQVRGRHHPRVLMTLYGLADATLAGRLHAAVFSAAAGTPAVALGYLPKMRGFFELLGRPGDCLTPADWSNGGLTAALGRLLADRAAAAADVRARVAALRLRACDHARLVATLVDRNPGSAGRKSPGVSLHSH
ncbi:MAG: polysaccharide pyruvyl transferase family protein [Candidatus Krumholzibacteriia bacterium]